MSVYLKDSSVLLDDSGNVAISADCCCEGACCAEDGTCTVETESDCTDAGGTFQGIGTDCDPNPCGTGACCFDDGSCLVETGSDCSDAGGTFQGGGTDCDPNPCTICGSCGFTGFLGMGHYLVQTDHQTKTAHVDPTPFEDGCDFTSDITTTTTVTIHADGSCSNFVDCSGSETFTDLTTFETCTANWVSFGIDACHFDNICGGCTEVCGSCGLVAESDTVESCTCDFPDPSLTHYSHTVTLSSPFHCV